MNTQSELPATGTMEMEAADVITNGVNVTALQNTIEAVQGQPELAEFKFRAKNRWLGGGHNRATANEYYGTMQEMKREEPFVFDCDEPPVLLGEDRGANPVEYVLAALSGCMTTALAYHAAARGLELESVESEYEGDIDLHGFLDLDPNTRKGFQEIRVKFKVKGDATEEEIEKLVRMSPVFDIVTNPVPVKILVEKA